MCRKITTTVECRNPNVRISDSAESRTIDFSVFRRSDFGHSGRSNYFKRSDFGRYTKLDHFISKFLYINGLA